MEFLVVSRTKLKIVLDRSEVEKYRLSDFSSGESSELRSRLGEILKEAKTRVGFDSRGERLLVSYYPTRLAGAEIFVTVIGVGGLATRYYIFGSLDELARACAAANAPDIDGALYLLPSGEYCLAVHISEDQRDVLSEFADAGNESTNRLILSRARLIKDSGAVGLLASMYVG